MKRSTWDWTGVSGSVAHDKVVGLEMPRFYPQLTDNESELNQYPRKECVNHGQHVGSEQYNPRGVLLMRANSSNQPPLLRQPSKDLAHTLTLNLSRPNSWTWCSGISWVNATK